MELSAFAGSGTTEAQEDVMASYFNLTLDTAAPTGAAVKINNGETATNDPLVT